MGLSMWTAAGLVALAAAGVVWFTHAEEAGKLQKGELKAIDYQIVSTRAAARDKLGSRVEITYTDPISQQAVSRNLPVQLLSDEAAKKYPAGAVRKGWVHTGLDEPFLHEEKPDLSKSAGVDVRVAFGLVGLGLGLLAFAWKTGRLFS